MPRLLMICVLLAISPCVARAQVRSPIQFSFTAGIGLDFGNRNSASGPNLPGRESGPIRSVSAGVGAQTRRFAFETRVEIGANQQLDWRLNYSESQNAIYRFRHRDTLFLAQLRWMPCARAVCVDAFAGGGVGRHRHSEFETADCTHASLTPPVECRAVPAPTVLHPHTEFIPTAVGGVGLRIGSGKHLALRPEARLTYLPHGQYMFSQGSRGVYEANAIYFSAGVFLTIH